MKLAKTLGRIGFAFGFLGPLLFYCSPVGLFTYESPLVCPLCPNVDMIMATKFMWLQLALEFGLLFGLLFGLAGFGLGYVISKFRASSQPQSEKSA